MKKIVCYLLIVWIALMSGGANAHMHSVSNHSHEGCSAPDHDQSNGHVANLSAEPTSILADGSKLDANNTETFTQAHYSHSDCHHHASGLPASCDLLVEVQAPSLRLVSYLSIFSSTISNNIERPKWLVTTPAVVSPFELTR